MCGVVEEKEEERWRRSKLEDNLSAQGAFNDHLMVADDLNGCYEGRHPVPLTKSSSLGVKGRSWFPPDNLAPCNIYLVGWLVTAPLANWAGPTGMVRRRLLYKVIPQQ